MKYLWLLLAVVLLFAAFYGGVQLGEITALRNVEVYCEPDGIQLVLDSYEEWHDYPNDVIIVHIH